MQDREQEDFLSDVSNEDICNFLRICALGNMDTDGSQLSQEEQEQLFNMLDRLNKSGGVDVKGIWPILSLSFKNRSGLVLMTMFYNSKVELDKLLYKKSFSKDIQTLQNRNFTKKNLYRILQITGIEKQVFLQKCYKQRATFQKIKFQPHNTRVLSQFYLSEEKIFDEFEFDSEPQYQYYQELKDLQNDKTIYQNFSVILNKNYFQEDAISESGEQFEETISLPIKRKFHDQQKTIKKTKAKRKKSKRPNHKRKKSKIIQQLKKQDIQAINFISARKEKRRLKQNYKLLNLDVDQNALPSKKKPNNPRLNSPRRNEIDSEDQFENSNHHNQPQNSIRRQRRRLPPRDRIMTRPTVQMIDQNESSSQQYFVIQKDIQEDQSIQEEQEQYRYKRLAKNVEQSVQEQIQIIQNQTAFNESIQNLVVKEIKFPLTIFDINKLNPEMEQERQFNTMQYLEFLQASTNTKKQAKNLMKQIMAQKNNIEFENVYRLVKMLKFDFLRDYGESYIKPILQYKIIKILATIVGDIVSMLYTSSNLTMHALYKSCKCLVELFQKCRKQQEQKFQLYVEGAIKSICQDFQQIRTPTNSKVQLIRPVQVIKSCLKIKLQQEDFHQTALVALLILYNGFLVKLFGHNFISESEDSPLQKILKKRVHKNPKFLVYISQIYESYNIKVSSKQQLYGILSLAKEIDLKNDDHEIQALLSNFVFKIISSFIQIRLKENTSFKTILSYVVRNQFLEYCQKAVQIGYEVTIRKYEAFLQFQIYHEDTTIQRLLRFINLIDFTKNFEEQFFLKILDLLIKCYEIKLQTNQPGSGVSNFQKSKQNKKMIKLYLQKIIKVFCEKYDRFEQLELIPNKQLELSNVKKAKFSKVISAFYEKFIQNQKLSGKVEHYLYTLQILFNHIWPVLSKSSKQDSFTVNLTENFLQKIYQIQSICSNLEAQAKKIAASTEIMDEQEQMDYLFQIKQETNRKIHDFLSEVANVLKQINVGQKISKQFLSFLQMKKYRQNILYEIHGVLTALSFFNPSGINSVKMGILKQLGEHVKIINLERTCRPFKSTNRLVLEYLKGLFKTVKIFSHGNIIRQIQDIGKDIRDNILDILLIGLVCEKDTKFVTELIEASYKITGFNKNEHLLITFPIHKHSTFFGKARTDLQFYLESVSQNKIRLNNSLMFRLIDKFNVPIFNVVNRLYKQYDEVQWKQMQAYIGLNLLNIFVFLFNVHASENLIKMYRPSFIINDISVMTSKNNILLGLEIEQFSQFSCQHKLVQFFRVIYENNKNHLSKTIGEFFKYISIQQIRPQKLKNQGQKFVKIRLLIEAIYVDKADSISCEICMVLLSSFLAQAFLREETQQPALEFFFPLFKRYPYLNYAFLQIFKVNCQKMDKIIKSNKNYNLLRCRSVEEAIKKYIINQYCLFEQLYPILERRVDNHLRFEKFDQQPDLNEAIEKCIKILEKLDRQSDRELVQKYRRLWLRLSQRKILFSLGQPFKIYNGNQENQHQLN